MWIWGPPPNLSFKVGDISQRSISLYIYVGESFVLPFLKILIWYFLNINMIYLPSGLITLPMSESPLILKDWRDSYQENWLDMGIQQNWFDIYLKPKAPHAYFIDTNALVWLSSYTPYTFNIYFRKQSIVQLKDENRATPAAKPLRSRQYVVA